MSFFAYFYLRCSTFCNAKRQQYTNQFGAKDAHPARDFIGNESIYPRRVLITCQRAVHLLDAATALCSSGRV
jgi:hypothetical protein